MIFLGGGRGGCLLVGLIGLLLLGGVGGGGSGGFLFLMMIIVGIVFLVGVPLSGGRGRVHREVRVLGPGGWSGTTWPPPQPQQPDAWSRPPEPVLPSVTAADVGSLRDRLGHDVRSLEPGADPVASQAMADASERYSTASTLLERASSDAQLRTAWLAAVEGLAATQVVRQRLGLDLGPPVPTLPGHGPQLTSHARIDVGGRQHVGAPTYEPGRPHWFPGGYYGGRPVPGGWYDMPFWPSALLLGGLAGWTLGGLGAGAVYGDDLGGDLAGGWDGGGLGSGGTWGDSGGGLGGGGDWGGGGFGGGGDWGGGGDFGGGGDW